MQSAQNVYTRVTEKIIADLEQGVRPWTKPWHAGTASASITLPRRHCGTPYRGINILLLWSEASDKGCTANTWMTYRQAVELGGQVRKGEHGSLVVYANRVTRTESDESGEEIERQIPFMKGYTVFNADQIEWLPAEYYPKPEPQREPMQLIERAEQFIAATGATIRHGGDRAYYAPGPDLIQLPCPEAFRDAESYASTALHEVCHWSGHSTRLDRAFGKRFGDGAYAADEIAVEISAAMLCALLGITPDVREDHAAYVGHWLKILKADHRAIFTAASHAQRAVEYLEGLQQPKEAAA